MQKYRTYLIFGAPGSGKGTQGKILGAIPRFYHCACGDVFRALDTRTELGQAFIEYSSRGQLVPDDLTVKLWKARIADHDRRELKRSYNALLRRYKPEKFPQEFQRIRAAYEQLEANMRYGQATSSFGSASELGDWQTEVERAARQETPGHGAKPADDDLEVIELRRTPPPPAP